MGKRKNDKRYRLAVLLLAVLMLCGCTTPAAPADPTANTTIPTTPIDPTQPSDPTAPSVPEVPDDPAPLPELAAVTYLNCVELDVFPELLSLGNGLVVASRNTYSELQGRINETLIIDIYKDEVVAKSVRAHSMELVQRKFADGAIVMAEPDSGKFFVFDRNLSVKSTFSAPNLDGYFSTDRSSYYYVQEAALYRMDVATGKSAAVDCGLRFRSLVGIHPEKDILVARINLAEQGSDFGVAVVDGKTEEILLLRDDLAHVWLMDDRFGAVAMNSKNLSYDVYYGSLAGGDVRRIPTDQLYSSSVGYGMLPGTDYLLWRLNPDEGDKATKIYDLADGGAVAELIGYEFDKALLDPVYLPQEQAILGIYSIKEEKTEENPYPKESFFFVVINPLKLEFTQSEIFEICPWQETVDMNAVDYLKTQE